jgi:dsRNA-specific ribonuclease
MAHQAKRKHINGAFKSDPSHPLSGPPSIHCAATDMEAIVGAVWIDSGRNFEVVKGVMKSLDIYPDQA